MWHRACSKPGHARHSLNQGTHGSDCRHRAAPSPPRGGVRRVRTGGRRPPQRERQVGERAGAARPVARGPGRAPVLLDVARGGGRDRRGGRRAALRDRLHGRGRRDLRRLGEPHRRDLRAPVGAAPAVRRPRPRHGQRRRGGGRRDAAPARAGPRPVRARRGRDGPAARPPHLRRPAVSLRGRGDRRGGPERLRVAEAAARRDAPRQARGRPHRVRARDRAALGAAPRARAAGRPTARS